MSVPVNDRYARRDEWSSLWNSELGDAGLEDPDVLCCPRHNGDDAGLATNGVPSCGHLYLVDIRAEAIVGLGGRPSSEFATMIHRVYSKANMCLVRLAKISLQHSLLSMVTSPIQEHR